VIFTHGPEQERIAKEKTEALAASHKFKRPVVTVIEPAPSFWRAEDYHQRYFEKNGLPSCHLNTAEG
jgi:peptide-methionine (S)-S-oxide reductase